MNRFRRKSLLAAGSAAVVLVFAGCAEPDPAQNLPSISSGLLCPVIQDGQLDVLCGEIAAANNLQPDDIQMRISHPIKSFKVEILFRKLPESGGYDLSMIDREKVSEKAGVKWDGIFGIAVYFPGGDVSGLLNQPSVYTLTKTTALPVVLNPEKWEGKPVCRLTVSHFTMADLTAVKTAFPESTHGTRETFVKVKDPADGVLDWRVIASFPKTGIWQFEGVTGSIGTDAVPECGKMLFPEDSACVVELPAGLKCRELSGSAAQCAEFRKKADKAFVQWLTLADWHDALGFPNLEKLTLSEGELTDWPTKKDFPKVKRLFFDNCEIPVPEQDPGFEYIRMDRCYFWRGLELKMEEWYSVTKSGGMFGRSQAKYQFQHK